MTNLAEGDLALACSALLVDELVRAGLAGACLAPGSRSTPVALALARHPGVSLQVFLDERSAAFYALGVAKATRAPAVVACTSGTAAANLLPAVVEAAYSGVPLIALTADRPPELRDTGSNQTIDQIKLFGGFVNRFVEAGPPEPRKEAARYWRSLGARAAAWALGPPAGPVHINLAFREPLAPTGAPVDLGAESAGRPGGRPWERVSAGLATPGNEDLAELAALIDATERGVVIAGGLDRDAPSILELAPAAGWPLIAEPTSGLRRGPALGAAQLLVAGEDFTASHRPEAVLQFGAAPTSRSLQGFVAGAGELVVIDPGGRFPDPARHAARTIRSDPDALAQALLSRVRLRAVSEWLAEWQEADGRARAAVNSLLDSWEEPFEGRAARDLCAALPSGATLVVASSMPVRDLDAYAAPREGIRVISNRGASGIDGFVSTTLGIAAAGSPTYALLGDLSLLHDAGALLWGSRGDHRAVLVVLNNDGGGIFDFLPQRSLEEHEQLFITPHGLDLEKLSAAANAFYQRVNRAGDLLPALARASSQGALSLIEVPIDRGRARSARREVKQAVSSALASMAGRRVAQPAGG